MSDVTPGATSRLTSDVVSAPAAGRPPRAGAMPSAPTADVLRRVSVPRFAAKPIAAADVPQCPALAPNGRNNMHNDAYMSDAYAWPGPAGGPLSLRFGPLSGLCATLTFDARGRIITVCSGVTRTGDVERALLLLDPETLEVLASHDLPSGGGGATGFGGGGYIFLNHAWQPTVPTADQHILVFDLLDAPPRFAIAQQFDLRGAIGSPDASVQSAMPDWSGRIWWVTDSGMVGYTDPASGGTWTLQLPDPQRIGNSFAVDETGGVFIASDYAMYRFDVARTGEPPAVTWSANYDRGTRQKPGQQNFGTGTTPTLVGRSWCGITDNADPLMHVVVYRREREYDGDRCVCQQSVFTPGESDTENSLIGYADRDRVSDEATFFVENNYGYTGTLVHETGPVTPGLARVTCDGARRTATTAWENDSIVIPSVVSKLSLANGLLYSYTLEIADGRQDWYISAVDASTGAVAYKVLAGSGVAFDNHYASLFIGPNGTVYVPVWSGIVSLREDEPSDAS